MAEAFGIVVRICTTHGIAIPDESDIKHLIDSNKFLLAANALRANMGDEKWLEFLSEIFDRPSAPLTDFHRLLFRIPFAAAATTNYETLLERGFKESKLDEPVTVFTQVDHEQLGKALGSKSFFCIESAWNY